MADGQVVIQVKSNAASAAKDFDKLDKSLDNTEKELKQVDKQADKTADSFKGLKTVIGAAIGAVAVRELAQFSKGLVDVASNAEETANKFNVVFSGVRGEAEATADALASGYGLASDEAQKLLSDTGDLLTGFGFTQEAALGLSKELNTLAVDLASFTNVEGGTERAAAALTSALFGETEAAKSLGIVITQDVVKAKVAALEVSGRLTNESENEKKAIATLALAYEQSKNAIGDFARSQESFANQTRILQASIQDLKVTVGSELLPVFTDGVFVLNTFAEALNNALGTGTDLQNAQGRLGETTARVNELKIAIAEFRDEFDGSIADKFIDVEDSGQFKALNRELIEALQERRQAQAAFNVERSLAAAEDEKATQAALDRQVTEQAADEQKLQSFKLLTEEAAKLKVQLQDLFVQGGEDTEQFAGLKAEYEGITAQIQGATDATKKFKEASVESFDFAGSAADNFSRNATRSLLSPWEEGETAADRFKEVALNTIADILAEFIAAELKKQAVALVTAVLTGGSSVASGFFTGAAGGTTASAKGNAFSGGAVTDKFANGGAFTNSIVSSPTTFPMAGGKTGLMGEAGPEAIMPLDRDSSGRLGVQVQQAPVVNNIINNAPVQIQTVSRPNNQNDIIISQVNNALSSSDTSQGFAEAQNRNSQIGAFAI